jgi:phage head maturation protease
MSFAFKAVRQSFDTKTEVRTINELKLYDVSVVTFPANPATVAQMRTDEPAGDTPPAGRSLALARRQLELISHG